MSYVHVHVDFIPQAFGDLQAGFFSGKLDSIESRRTHLTKLVQLVNDNLEGLEDALKQDLGRHAAETRTVELLPTMNDIQIYLDHVDAWSKPEHLWSNADYTFESLYSEWFSNHALFNREKKHSPTVQKVPKGVALIISPPHYPVRLTLGPLAAALAAGCTVFVKSSELTPATSALLTSLMDKHFDSEIVRMVNGAFPDALKILEYRWDHVFYGGGGGVAQKIAVTAAKELRSYTITPSAKSPVIIDPNYDLEKAAKAILWAKIVNAGQSFAAPDYVVVPEEIQDDLVSAFIRCFSHFFPQSTVQPGTFTNLIFPSSTFRIASLLQRTRGDIVFGGRGNRYFSEEEKYHCPTLVKNVKPEDVLMKNEIFGPILPIVPVKNLDTAIAYAALRATHDRPLTAAVFTDDEEVKQKVFNEMKGGVTVIANDTFVHPGGSYDRLYQYNLRASKRYFDTFSTLKMLVDSSPSVYGTSPRFPPYTDSDNSKLHGPIMRRATPRHPIIPVSTLNTFSQDVAHIGHALWKKETLFGLIASVQIGLLGTRIAQALGRAR